MFDNLAVSCNQVVIIEQGDGHPALIRPLKDGPPSLCVASPLLKCLKHDFYILQGLYNCLTLKHSKTLSYHGAEDNYT